MSTQPSQPLAADGAALARVLQAAGADKNDLIRVTGPSGAIAALWLARHGYARALFVRSFASMVQPAELALIPHACSADELAKLVGDGEVVGDGGVIIVQADVGRLADGFEAVAALLRKLGCHSQRRIDDKGRAICIARRVGFPSAAQAA